MAYKTPELKKLALKEIKERKLVFIEDVVSFLPCSKPTFYKHKLNEVDELKDIIQDNKTNLKITLRKKWEVADNATLQLALYKLICTDEERRKIAMNYNEVTGKDGESIGVQVYVLPNGDELKF